MSGGHSKIPSHNDTVLGIQGDLYDATLEAVT